MGLEDTEFLEIGFRRANATLPFEEERLKLALQAGRIGMVEYNDEGGAITVDEGLCQQFGLGETDTVTFEVLMNRIHENDRQDLRERFSHAIGGEEPFEIDCRLSHVSCGDTWIRIRGLPYTNRDGRRIVIGSTQDVTNETLALQNQKTQLRELSHRLHNLFAVVSALIQSAPKATAEVATFADDLVGRIVSLGRAYDLTRGHSSHGTVDLETLLRSTIEPHITGQSLTLWGPEVEVGEEQITTVALVLHELVTNAVKHGAIGVPDGCLDITWSKDAEGRVTLIWKETVADFLATGEEEGFGTQLVETGMAQLNGSFRRSYDTAGANIELIARLQPATAPNTG